MADCATCGGFGFVNCSWCQGRAEPDVGLAVDTIALIRSDTFAPIGRRNEAQHSQPVPAWARGQRAQVYCLQRGGAPALHYMLDVYYE